MKYLTSRKNEFIQKVKYLHTKKGRDDLSLFIVEGEKMVLEAISGSAVNSLIVSETYNRLHPDVIYPDMYLLKDDVFEYISDTVNSQGISALVKIKKEVIENTVFELIAEDLKDPGNLGTILRTSESFGIQAVSLTSDCADPYNMKTVRASMGSILRMPVQTIDDIGSYVNKKRSEGYRILAGHLNGMDIDRRMDETYSRAVLIIGNESRGISEKTKALCDELVRIPIFGKNESLNASVAAGILLYEIRKRLI